MNTLLICIQNESDAMATLVEVLRLEQAALTQAPSLELMEEINAITQKKNGQIVTINQLGKLRKTEIARLGFAVTDSATPQWLQDQAQKDCWNKLVGHTRKANELNRVNGLLISKHLLRNQSTLQVLYRNHQGSAAPSLYGANGQANSRRSVVRGFVA
jgi:flagella synthesis protein FlgN